MCASIASNATVGTMFHARRSPRTDAVRRFDGVVMIALMSMVAAGTYSNDALRLAVLAGATASGA
jgi:hypothetical protein